MEPSLDQQSMKDLECLFIDQSTKQLSQTHFSNHIVLNPLAVCQLIDKSDNLQLLSTLKTVLDQFSLNYLHVASNTDIFPILVARLMKQSSSDNQNLKNILLSIFDRFNEGRDVPRSTFTYINGVVVQEYYNRGNISPQIYEMAVTLVGKIYDKMLKKQAGCDAQPQIYLLSARDELRIELTNAKWPFAKGMFIKAWLYPEQCECKKESILWYLQTEDKKEMELKLINEQLFFSLSKGGQPLGMIPVGKIATNCWNSFSIELQPAGGFSFGGYSYRVNVRFNENSLKDLNIELPKFSSSQFITDFILFRSFVGRVSWVMVSNLAGKEGPGSLTDQQLPRVLTQELLHDILQLDILKRQNIVAFYLPSRSYCGLLLNVLGNQTNNGVFTGFVSNSQGNSLEFFRHLDALIPYFFLLRAVKEPTKLFNQLLKLYHRLLQHDPTYDKYFLFITYFIISENYSYIDEESLSMMAAMAEISQTVQKTLAQMSLELIMKKKIQVPQKLKLLLMIPAKTFFKTMEAEWNKLWSGLQSFCKIWSHPNFNSQNNKPFNSNDYVFDEKKKPFYQWSINNFTTKELARPLIEPAFIEPSGFKRQHLIELDTQDCHVLLEILEGKSENTVKQVALQRVMSKTEKLKSLISRTSLKESNKGTQKTEVKWLPYQTECLWVNHLTVIYGTLEIAYGQLIFTSAHISSFDHMAIVSWKSKDIFSMRWPIDQIVLIKRRRFNQMKQCIEIFLQDTSSYVFHLAQKDVEVFLSKIPKVKVYRTPIEHFTESKKPDDWIDKKISNFEYIMWINFVSGRSYQDLTQYPIFPWTYIGFGHEFNINDISHYRNLSKNMGSVGAQSRKKYFVQKYESKNQYELVSEFHYGTHYSSSAIICNFLIRLKPYSDGAMSLQSGKFDVADRVFAHYEDSWTNATNSPSDVRELIPDFYVLPELFININNYDYGLTQNQERIDNVVLPKWAKKNPYVFVAILRKSLQSQFFNKNITGWIDLIYGYKQRGREAIAEMNIFYHLTYEDCLDLDSVEDLAERVGFESQIAHFGQTPSQVIPGTPHPTQTKNLPRTFMKLLSDGSEAKIMKNLDRHDSIPKNNPVIFNSILEHPYSMLRVRFYKEHMYAVFKKQQIGLYLISRNEKKEIMITKEESLKYEIETPKNRMDIRSMEGLCTLPFQHLSKLKCFAIGGYYFGYANLIFYEDKKQNQFVKMTDSTITALASQEDQLFVGNFSGKLSIFKIQALSNLTILQEKFDHEGRITDISVSASQNLFCTSSQDSRIYLYNLYSRKLLRSFENPFRGPVMWARISSSPLFCMTFYSPKNSTIYSYSINGQFLNALQDNTDMVHGPFIIKDSAQQETLVFVNASKAVHICELPNIDLRRKIQLKKNETPRISCFECNDNGTAAVIGTIEGHAYIVMDPQSY